MTFNFLGPGLTVNVEAKVKEQIILDISDFFYMRNLLIDIYLQSHKNVTVTRLAHRVRQSFLVLGA